MTAPLAEEASGFAMVRLAVPWSKDHIDQRVRPSITEIQIVTTHPLDSTRASAPTPFTRTMVFLAAQLQELAFVARRCGEQSGPDRGQAPKTGGCGSAITTTGKPAWEPSRSRTGAASPI